MEKNTLEKYGLNIIADYRTVVFGDPVVKFVGEGVLQGSVLKLAGEGTLEVSGKGEVTVEGHGALTIELGRSAYFTIVNYPERDGALVLICRGDIQDVVRLAVMTTLQEGTSYVEKSALKVVGNLDYFTAVTHAPHSTADIRTRLVLEDGAKAIARGTMVIGEQAVGAKGAERIDALLLGDKAEVDVLPVLHVANDDVTCKHGATVGHVDQGALFYLASRGLAEGEAKQVLAEAFLAG